MNRPSILLFTCLFTCLFMSSAFAPALRAGDPDFEDVAQSDALAGLTESSTYDELSNEERSDLEHHGLGAEELGVFRAAHRSGFDIYRDTPDFDNFSGTLSKGGTCTGVSTFVKLMYKNVTFDPTPVSGQDAVEEALKVFVSPVLTRRTIHGARDFREFCERHPEFRRRLEVMMEVAHLNNLNPRTIAASLEGRLGLQNGMRTTNAFALRAANDCPSLVVMNPKGLDTGHCCLAYKVLRFEKASLVYIYDPNFVYDPARKNHRRSLLKLDHETKDLRLFPASYDGMYGGDFDRITCAEGLEGIVISRLRGVGDRLVENGVDLGRRVATGTGQVGRAVGVGVVQGTVQAVERVREFGDRTRDGLRDMGNSARDLLDRLF